MRSRLRLTLSTAFLLEIITVVAIIGFNIIRIFQSPNQSYQLPHSVRGQVLTTNSDVFRYHFFADIIPGLLLFSQIHLCSMVQHELLSRARRKFTFGEASIISQLVSAAYSTWALTTYSRYSGAGPFEVSLTTDIVLNIGFIMFVITFIPPYSFLRGRYKFTRYFLLLLASSISYLVIQSLITPTSNRTPIIWLADYIFATHQRLSLFSLWLSTVTGCISFSISWANMVGRTNSLARKIFHLAIVVVFITGYNQDLDFSRFASGGILVVMFVLEVVRAWQLEPLSNALEKVCQAMRGKWDNKYITLSHIYLLVGIFLPLWLLPNNGASKDKLRLASGLISVGVGDSAAAIVGTLMGVTKIRRNSEKSIEGFIGNIISMIIFQLVWIGYVDFSSQFSFLIAAILTAVVEVVSNTCDNLVLPLVMLFFMEVF